MQGPQAEGQVKSVYKKGPAHSEEIELEKVGGAASSPEGQREERKEKSKKKRRDRGGTAGANGSGAPPEKKKKGRKPKNKKRLDEPVFELERLGRAQAQVERRLVIETLKLQHEQYLAALIEENLTRKSRRLKKKIEELRRERVGPDPAWVKATLRVLSKASPHARMHPAFQTPRRPTRNVERPTRNVERPNYCVLAGERGRKRPSPPRAEPTAYPLADQAAEQQEEDFSEECEDDEEDLYTSELDSEGGEMPQVVVQRQRGRPRKGQEGIKRHAILQIKVTEGVDKLHKNSEVQMILDKIYGRAPPESDPSASPRNTDETGLEGLTRAASEPQSLRKRPYRQTQASPIVATNKGDFQMANVLLGSTHGRVNMENWTNHASIQTPHFRVLLEPPSPSPLPAPLPQPIDQLQECTDDELYTALHISEERKEKSRDLIVQNSMRKPYRKKRPYRVRDPSRRKPGRPPRRGVARRKKQPPSSLVQDSRVRIDLTQQLYSQMFMPDDEDQEEQEDEDLDPEEDQELEYYEQEEGELQSIEEGAGTGLMRPEVLLPGEEGDEEEEGGTVRRRGSFSSDGGLAPVTGAQRLSQFFQARGPWGLSGE